MSEQKSNEATSASETEPSKKRKKRASIVIGVVAAVLVVAGAGFWVWHEQPSFCNAICHVSMDPYLPTYEAEPGQASVDKWGNPVSDASAMMAPVHRADAECNASCMSCHVPTLGEQVSEAGAWITGDYDVVSVGDNSYCLIERTLDELVAARDLPSGDDFCLNESCHNLTREDLIEATSYMERNPHVEQHGDVSCGTCHKAHRASVVYCSKCHADTTIPEGWLSMGEEQQLEWRAN